MPELGPLVADYLDFVPELAAPPPAPLAAEREMHDLLSLPGEDASRDRAMDRWWALRYLIAETEPMGATSAAVKLRCLLHPTMGMETGDDAENDYPSLRQILAFLQREAKEPAVIGFGEPLTPFGSSNGRRSLTRGLRMRGSGRLARANVTQAAHYMSSAAS